MKVPEDKMYRIVEWDGTIEVVAALFYGGNVFVTYLQGEEICHEVSSKYFWDGLQAVPLAAN